MTVKRRQQIEKAIVRQVVRSALQAGYSVSVNNGGDEDEAPPSTDYSTINKLLFATDQDDIVVHAGKRIGVVNCVYGNDGYDVIADYSVNLEHILGEALALADLYEEGM